MPLSNKNILSSTDKDLIFVNGLSAEFSYSSTDEDVCSLQTINEDDDEDALGVSSIPSEEDLREELEQVHISQVQCLNPLPSLDLGHGSTSAQDQEGSPKQHEIIVTTSEIPLGSSSRTPLKLLSSEALQSEVGQTISDDFRAP
ncbi:hypothetical protein Dimus_007913 [Dionaea muscipula]